MTVVKWDKLTQNFLTSSRPKINSDTSINGEELELSGNLSDFITEEHIEAREARLTFDQERQVKFTVNADYEGECPLRLGFETVETMKLWYLKISIEKQIFKILHKNILTRLLLR